MGLRERVMELLRTGQDAALESLVAQDRRTVRYVLGRLWDNNAGIRQRAASVLGSAACAHPDLVEDVIRRLMWALNDESGTNGVYGVPALAEIGNRNPRLIAPFVGPMASLLWDEGLRSELLAALTRIAESAPELVAPFRNEVERFAETLEPDQRAHLMHLLDDEPGGRA
jgi:hypothetical protein